MRSLSTLLMVLGTLAFLFGGLNVAFLLMTFSPMFLMYSVDEVFRANPGVFEEFRYVLAWGAGGLAALILGGILRFIFRDPE